MSDRYNPLGVPTIIRPQAPTFSPPRLSMTDYEQQLNPYFDQLMAQEKDKRNWLRPVQWILERLQTGQFISANIANELVDAFDNNPDTRVELMKAIYEGVTGKTKGSYEQVFRRMAENRGVQLEPIFKNAPEGTRRSQWDAATVLGFIGDIVLDPLTWVNPLGGAAKGAEKAASTFADDAVRVALKKLAEQPADIIARTVGKQGLKNLDKAIAVGTNRGIGALAHMGDDLGRFIDLTYRSAKKVGLQRSADELATFMTRQIDNLPGMEQLAGDLATRYAGAGTRYTVRALGKDVGVHQAGGARQALTQRNWDRFARLYENADLSKPTLQNAVWGVMNRGPIGEIRRALHFRTPYQQYLDAQKLEAVSKADVAAYGKLREAMQTIGGLSEPEKSAVRDFIMLKENNLERVVQKYGDNATLASVPAWNLDPIDAAPEVREAAFKIKEIFDGVNADERMFAQSLNESAPDYIEWYLPAQSRFTSKSGASPRAGRKYTYEQHLERETALYQLLYNTDAETARKIVETNTTGLVTDLNEIMAQRMMVYGKAKQRYEIINSLKQFGIDLGDSQDEVAQKLLMGGRDIKEMGVRNVDLPAFQNPDGTSRYLFDDDVANMIERVAASTGAESNIFMRGMHAFATWWKGIVTATTGFHARNFISDSTNLFLHRGIRAFDFKQKTEAMAGVASILAENSKKGMLGQLNLDDVWFAKTVNRRIGNYTIDEFAHEMEKRGLISGAIMGFEPQNIVETVAGKGAKTPLRSASRWLGNRLENVNRLHAAMIDYGDLAAKADAFPTLMGKQLDDALKAADASTLDWVAREAKKISIDYQDLSDFEKGVLRNVIPFYTYTRKNLSRQLVGVFSYPDLYSLLPKLQELAQYDDPNYDKSFVPEWMRDMEAFPTAKTEEGYRFMVPGQQFSVTGLNLIPLAWQPGKLFPQWDPKNLRDEVINSTAPWIRRMAGVLMQTENPYDFFYQQELEPTSDAPYLMRLFASRPGSIAMLDGILKMAGFKNGAHLDERDGKLQIDSRMAVTLSDFLPVIRQLDFLFYLPQTVVPGLEKVIEGATGAQDDYEGAAQVMQMLSYYLGIKVTDQSVDLERQRLGRDIYYQAQDLLNTARQQMPGYSQRSLASQRQRLQSIRRLGG